MKIIYACGSNTKDSIKEDLDEFEKAGFNVTFIDQTPLEKDFLKEINLLKKDHDVLIVSDNHYSSESFESIKDIYKALYCVDDPDGSDFRSKPYVKGFDHCFTGAVNYDKNTRMTKKYLEWGAKRADWWPLGFSSHGYNQNIGPELVEKERKIDLVHIGNPQNKTGRLLKIYKIFSNVSLFGRSFGIKGLLRTWYHILKRKKGWCEGIPFLDLDLIKMFLKSKPITRKDMVDVYQNSKIGINIHLSFGPANMRLYELPANGILQICDCKEGLGKVFKIGKEVVLYETEEEAIQLIKYYLQHEEERKKIALAGWRRCLKDYRRTFVFKVAMEKIKKGMIESGIKNFKDGKKIILNKKLLKFHNIKN